ncbi:MAG TPA: hypothetical protein VGJ75_09165 [Dongiaceae bacterium]|jgi:hypothetical protein
MGSGIVTGSGSGACERVGIGGISIIVVGSEDASDVSDDAVSEGAGSCGACMRANGVIGIGPRLAPEAPAGGDWIERKNGSPRTSLAGRAISRAGSRPVSGRGVSTLGAVAPDGPRSPRKRLSAAATLA